MNKNLPLYVADLQEGDGLQCLSIVKRPATYLQWKVIDRAHGRLKVFAPILPANTPIYRHDNDNGSYNVLFTPGLIEDVVEKYAGERVRFDVEHNGHAVEDVRVCESFIVNYSRKTLYNGYYGLTDGSWVMVLSLPELLIPKFSKWDMLSPIGSEVPQNMVFNNESGCFRSEDFSGISISGIFSYSELSLSEAVEMYNTLKI